VKREHARKRNHPVGRDSGTTRWDGRVSNKAPDDQQVEFAISASKGSNRKTEIGGDGIH